MGTTKKRPGMLVETGKGHLGRTYNDESLVNGKYRVHGLESASPFGGYKETGTKYLCKEEDLKLLGFFD